MRSFTFFCLLVLCLSSPVTTLHLQHFSIWTAHTPSAQEPYVFRHYHVGPGPHRSKHQQADGSAQPGNTICLADAQASKVPSPNNPKCNLKSSPGVKAYFTLWATQKGACHCSCFQTSQWSQLGLTTREENKHLYGV